jgi:hypothetical protein
MELSHGNYAITPRGWVGLIIHELGERKDGWRWELEWQVKQLHLISREYELMIIIIFQYLSQNLSMIELGNAGEANGVKKAEEVKSLKRKGENIKKSDEESF